MSAVLKIRTADGRVVPIPAIKGDPGDVTPEYIAMYNQAMNAAKAAMDAADSVSSKVGNIKISVGDDGIVTIEREE